MKPISCNQEIGDKERFLSPEAPQGPSGYQCQHHLRRSESEAMHNRRLSRQWL